MSIGLAIPFIFHIVKDRHKYDLFVSLGMSLIASMSIMLGLVKIFERYSLFSQQRESIGNWAMLGFLGLPLIIISAYKNTADDPEKRKSVVIAGGVLIIIALLVGGIGILAYLF
ncbi:hypothetical protein [Paenibacillus ihuae]|uniref:hypothetical protein n=1 Tax=Paenibacillus ihuae TaxID=1232431 RepID=UPI001AE0BFA9|nr:hypothetical protein [Paenibacillus ihuae]